MDELGLTHAVYFTILLAIVLLFYLIIRLIKLERKLLAMDIHLQELAEQKVTSEKNGQAPLQNHR